MVFSRAAARRRITFEMGVELMQWDKPTESLLELVADNLADSGAN